MSEITPEQLAAALAGGFVAEKELNGWVDVSAKGAVAAIAFTPIRHEPGKDNVQHFRAVVVEGEEAPLVLEWPEELGISWHDGGDLLTLTSSGIIRLNPRGVDEWELSPQEALEMAAQLAAMATLAGRADDLEGAAFSGTTLPEADQGGAA